MNPRAEAFERLAGRYEVRVLEPSPPAVTEGPWFADDPAARGDVPQGRELVSPVSSGDLTWDGLAREDPALAAWAAERWLGAWRRLGPAPAALVATREALHRVAEDVFKPERERANGKFGLRFTRGGFGTPFFGADVQLRVEGAELVVTEAGASRRLAITTLRALADAAGLPEPDALPDAPLDVDPQAARYLGDVYGFGASVLEELRARHPDAEPSRVQLWPEHFDIATELGSEQAGQRAGFGVSPGDEHHPEPYLYVVPWTAEVSGELWQATGYRGAELGLAELLAADDQREAALAFFETRLAALLSG